MSSQIPSADTLQALMALFESHAHVKTSSPLDAPFLHRLLPGAQNISNVRNSFRGIYRLNRFMDDVQLKLGVCFGVNDAEKEWTPQSLAAHIDQKKSNRAAQKTLAEKRLKQARQYLMDGMVKSLLFLTLPLGIFVWYAVDGAAGRATGWALAALPSLAVLRFCLGEIRLYTRLLDILKS